MASQCGGTILQVRIVGDFERALGRSTREFAVASRNCGYAKCWEAPGRAPALKDEALASYVSTLMGGCHSIVTETLFDGVAEQALCTIAVHVPEASSPPSEALI